MRPIATLLICLLLAACGQTGPLYMPGGAPVVDDGSTTEERAPEDGVIN